MDNNAMNNDSLNTKESQFDAFTPYDATKTSLNYNAQVTHPILGWIGAIIGIAIGAALWILVMQIGYIVGIIGAGTLLLGVCGYMFLSKEKVSVITLVIILVIAAAAIFLAELIGIAYKAELDIDIVFLVLREYPEVIQDILPDIIFGYAFLGVGVFYANKYDLIHK